MFFLRMLWMVLLGSVSAVVWASHEQIIEKRQQAFKAMIRSFEPMGMMVRGSMPFKPELFQKHAANLLKNDAANLRYFPQNSHSDKSRAKPEIWQNLDAYKQEEAQFNQRVQALHAAAQTGDLKQIRPVFGQVAQSCKSCHDAFRLKKLPR